MRQDYFYVVREIDDGSHNGLVKIGHSHDPIKRPGQYQTGNWRQLETVFSIAGGMKLEKEFKDKFEQDKIGFGGDEWYRITDNTLAWISEKIKQSLVAAKHRCDIDFGGPINIPKIELGEAKVSLPRAIETIRSVQPYEVAEAHPSNNPYAKVGRKKTQ